MADLPASTGGLQRTGTGFVFTQAALNTVATLIVSDAGVIPGPLFECDIFLFTNELQPTGQTVYADLVKPTWTGWALALNKTFAVGLLTPSGVEMQCSTSAQWTVGADPDPEIWGWGVAEGGVLIGAELYEEPVSPIEDEILGFIPTISVAPQ